MVCRSGSFLTARRGSGTARCCWPWLSRSASRDWRSRWHRPWCRRTTSCAFRRRRTGLRSLPLGSPTARCHSPGIARARATAHADSAALRLAGSTAPRCAGASKQPLDLAHDGGAVACTQPQPARRRPVFGQGLRSVQLANGQCTTAVALPRFSSMRMSRVGISASGCTSSAMKSGIGKLGSQSPSAMQPCDHRHATGAPRSQSGCTASRSPPQKHPDAGTPQGPPQP